MGKRSSQLVRRYVDMWAVPGVHPTNTEFLQSYKMADSSHFTRNMDAVGTVSEENQDGKWEKNHLIGIRTDIWKPDAKDVAHTLENLQEKRRAELKKEIKKSGRLDAKQKSLVQRKLEEDKIMQMACEEIIQRRLVLKLFKTTGKRLNWAGTVEQVTTSEIQHSIGSQKTLLSFAAILPRYEFVVSIQQNYRAFRFGDVFTMSFYCDGRMWPICLQRRWGSVGADYDILVDGKRIGLIDGVLFAMGSDSYVNLDDHLLSKNSRFTELITLFAGSIGYHNSMRRSAAKRIAACKSGDWQKCIVEDEELSIHKNGRAA